MAKTFTYTFSTPGNSTVNVATGDTSSIYSIGGTSYRGYAVTGISGTFNGQTITGMLGTGGSSQTDNNANGTENGGPFDNTIFINSTQGSGGSSLNGIDNLGIGFSTSTGAHYVIYQNSATAYAYESGGTIGQTATLSSSNYAQALCFGPGTRILTARGEVAVEKLSVGDCVVTVSGARKLVAWIGSRIVECNSCSDPRQAWPVRVRAGAFGEGLPARDLIVSPDHALCIELLGANGVLGPALVPAFAFLNGATVVREPLDRVMYWHVELEGGHDVILAEGLPAESYLDCANRRFFAGEDVALDPGLAPLNSCLERTDDSARLAPVRAAMRERALALGWTLEAADPFAGLRLVADGALILPETDGLSARFLVPAAVAELHLVSGASVPWEVSDTGDARRLGLCVTRLTAVDGFGEPRVTGADDARLSDGWHRAEAHGVDHLRWTDGRAQMPAELFAELRRAFFLRVDLACPALPTWRAPAAELVAATEAGMRPRAVTAGR